MVFWRLGYPSFWDPDEAHYAETTRELLKTGDWCAPFFNEQPFFDKPILFYWFQAVPMAAIGPTEFAARLAPALAALALAGVTRWLGAKLASAEVGLVGALLLSASPATFALSRYAILDTLFTALLFSGVSLVAVAALHRQSRWQWPGYLLIALALLTKGPLAVVLCGLAFLLAIASSAETRRALLALHWIAGLVMIVIIAVPWFAYMWHRFGDAFVEGYILKENVRLYARSVYARQPSVWFYVRILALGLLPWTALFVGRLWDDVRRAFRRERLDAFEVLLWSWTITVLGFFTFSKFKLDHYLFPAAPTACLLCARAWVEVRARPGDSAHAGSRAGLRLVGPLLAAVGAAFAYLMIARLDLPRTAAVAPAVMIAAGLIVTVRANRGATGPPRVPWAVLIAMTVTYASVTLWMIPALEQRKVVPDLARWVTSHASASDRIASFRLNRWSTAFRFYVDRHVEVLDSAAEAHAFFARGESFYCVMPESAFEDFVAQGAPLERVYGREGAWATSGRALWRHHPTPARFVIARGRSLERMKDKG